MESAHQLSPRPDCKNTTDVPSLIPRAALSAIALVSELKGVNVQWFQERSSQALSKCQRIVSVNVVWLPRRLQELLQAPFLFPVKFLFYTHKIESIEWPSFCTTVAYRCLWPDSQPSLRTLWSAVIKSPKFTARGTTPLIRLLQRALVILVLWQISQFRSFGKWV